MVVSITHFLFLICVFLCSVHALKPLIVETGTALEPIRDRYLDLADWFYLALNINIEDVEIVRVYLGEDLPAHDPSRVVIITGSWGMVTDHEPWSENTAKWIQSGILIDAPMIGVCYGHQLMAYALGGTIDFFPESREIGKLSIRKTANGLVDSFMASFPDEFDVLLCHSQRVITIPDGAVVLAESEMDPHQIIRYSKHAISVQFHPEFFSDLLRFIVEIYRDDLQAERFDIDELLTSIQETPDSRKLLIDFVQPYL
ncbi:Glutamine amidotransferase domain containing protein ChyE-like protein [Aduncisulcus paluster]|uniref:Glutamine amidotransferase domain containing protein ChyE-like protein n=1 Tax=Aduncisulcus paluster TaxID=2918883 RepID=A0ABQ5KVE1_9EUKA|nr:Glutamine amidotransferase domain containing protein ChyE-like protein [Aduncisulcus paluster]